MTKTEKKRGINLPHGLRPRVQTINTEPSMTKRSFAPECDINNIINKFKSTGLITHENPNNPQYGYAPANDFREAMEIVLVANQQFDQLPSNIRRKFANSPELFLEFCQNPENLPEMRELGLASKLDTQASEKPKEAVTASTETTDDKVPPKKDTKAPDIGKA